MSVKIYLNDMKYRYDIYHIINVFYSNEKLEFTDKQSSSLQIEINPDNIVINGKLKAFVKGTEFTLKERF